MKKIALDDGSVDALMDFIDRAQRAQAAIDKLTVTNACRTCRRPLSLTAECWVHVSSHRIVEAECVECYQVRR